jgi:hypothetical protein
MPKFTRLAEELGENPMLLKRTSIPTVRLLASLLELIVIGVVAFFGQTIPVNAQQVAAKTPTPYVSAGTVPNPARRYLFVLGDRIQKPGNERTTLVGTFTDKNGTTQAQLVWQAPGSVRFDRVSQPSKPLTYDSVTGLVSNATGTATDLNILESILDDPAEAFFYGFQNGKGYRLLGLRIRADNGRAANYQGPWYDVYAATGPVNAKPGKPTRVKHYYFDSVSGLPNKTRYVDSAVIVITQFDAWIQRNGQSFPGKIVRTENGTVVFTFTITSATAGGAQNDGIFSGQ